MTAVVKHMARTPTAAASKARTPVQARNSQLRERFPARPAQAWWPDTGQTAEKTLRRLTCPPFACDRKATRAGRRRGVTKLLRWLASFPGDTWQQQWLASGAEDHAGASWAQLPLGWLREHGLAASYDPEELSAGLLMLICGDVIRPGLAWMLTRTHRYLASVMAAARDPDGFTRLRQLATPARRVPQGRGDRRHQDRDHSGVQRRHDQGHHCRRLRGTGRHAAPGPCPRRPEEDRLLPAAARPGHLPRRRPGHHPGIRARPGPAEHRGTGGPLPAAVPASPRPAHRLSAGTAARA